MTNKYVKNLILSAMFLALGFVLPMMTGQIPVIGKILLPMHIPVFLCGLICDWKHGLAIGGMLSILRSLLFSVPVMYPTAIAVAFEMAVYGSVTGILYSRAKEQTVRTLYRSLLISMLLGRVVRCAAEIALLGFAGNAFVWKTFVTGVLLNAIPGVILQLVLIPAVMLALKRTAPSSRAKQ
jgi:thiamine transporter ThiT